MSQNYQQPAQFQVSRTSTTAIISLIAGIAGWVGVLGIGPLIAIICGHIAKSEINKSNGMVTGNGLATAGLILGYVNLALTLIGLCLVIVLPLLGFGGLAICAPFMNSIP
jgi:hypothetical protein